MVPDAIDPAASPSHWSNGQSVAVAGLISMAVPTCRRFAAECRESAERFRDLAAGPGIQPGERANHQCSELASRFAAGFAVGLPVGFLSHLGADAFMPGGLPII